MKLTQATKDILNVRGIKLSEGLVELIETTENKGITGIVLRVGPIVSGQFVEAQISFVRYLNDINKRGYGHLSLKTEAPKAYELRDLGVVMVSNHDLDRNLVDDWALYKGEKFDETSAVGVFQDSRNPIKKFFLGRKYSPIVKSNSFG